MPKPPEGLWSVKDKTITKSADTMTVTQVDLGYKPDGVYNSHQIVLSLTDSGGTAAECDIFGAAGLASDGSFIFVKLTADGLKTEEGFQVDPNADGVFYGFKFVFTGAANTTSKIFFRSYVKGLL